MRPLTIFFVLVFCCACSASAQKPQKEGLEYYEEASALYRKYIKLKSDSDKKIMAGKIIEALQNCYYADTTNTFTIDYLVIRTYELEYYDTCIYWAKKSLSNADKDERYKASQNSMIGCCYVFKADLKSAIPYLNRALLYVETDTVGNYKYEYRYMPWQTIRKLEKIAIDIVSDNSMPLRQTLLKKRVTPCRYAIQLLDYLRTVDPSTAKDAELITLRKKCQ